jgi:hypothetical protein
LIEAENRSQLMVLVQEGLNAGASIKAVANLFGICSRTLKRWDIAINAHGFSVDSRKGSLHNVVHKFTPEERNKVIETVNDPRFADLTPAQIVDILAEELIEGGAVGVHKQVVSSQHLSRALRAKIDEPFQTTRVSRMLTAKGFRFLTRRWWGNETCRVWTLQGEDLSVEEAIKLLDSTTGMDFLGV